MNYAPIRKVVAAAITFAIVYVAKRLGLDLGSSEVNDLVQGGLPIVAAWAVKDPRVRKVSEGAEAVLVDLDRRGVLTQVAAYAEAIASQRRHAAK